MKKGLSSHERKPSFHSTLSSFPLCEESEEVTAEEKCEEIIEDPWITEIKKLKVKPELLSSEYLDELYHEKVEQYNLPVDYFTKLRARLYGDKKLSRDKIKKPSIQNEVAGLMSMNEKTKLLLLRRKQLEATVSRSKPATASGSAKAVDYDKSCDGRTGFECKKMARTTLKKSASMPH